MLPSFEKVSPSFYSPLTPPYTPYLIIPNFFHFYLLSISQIFSFFLPPSPPLPSLNLILYFWSSFRFTAKLNRSTEISHPSPAPTGAQFPPHYQHPPPKWCICYNWWSYIDMHDHPEFRVYIRFTPGGVHFMSLDKCTTTCIYHYSIIQRFSLP